MVDSALQVNLITTVGECEFKASKSGKITLIGVNNLVQKLNANNSEKAEIVGNNHEKNYIIKGDAPFLQYLGVSDKNGRIYDKKQSKFRQINKFVENVRDIYPNLPKEGELVVYDLCCGKSYLSFAVYHQRKITAGGDRVYCKMLYPTDYEDVQHNTEIMKEKGLIVVCEPFFVDDELREKVTKWVEWANSVDQKEYDSFAE